MQLSLKETDFHLQSTNSDSYIFVLFRNEWILKKKKNLIV